jgi:N-acetylglutamate synthase-like GNAT family acetyltransferase/predicted transcriptional regulator
VDASKLQVFISSVMAKEDLSAERNAVREAIESITLTVPWAFELSPAEPSPAEAVYLREVRASDMLVLVVSNTHTSAVQAELDAADASSTPILAFVRSVDPDEETKPRRELLQWLRQRVKYRHFRTLDVLRELVVKSVSSEIVRGYRSYRERLATEDLKALLTKVEVAPSLIVRDATELDKPDVQSMLEDLEAWYPGIGSWIPKVLDDIQSPDATVRVAKLGQETAGVAVSRDKDSEIRKLSTLYVRPEFRGEAVGPHLVHEEVRRAARDGVRKVYVTYAAELRSQLESLFGRYGLVTEGISPGRYRSGQAEWVAGKILVHGETSADDFVDFVKRHIIDERGGRVRAEREPVLLVEAPRLLGMAATARTYRCVVSTSPTPEDEYEACSERLRGHEWRFVSLAGRPASRRHWGHQNRNWIDGYDVAAEFYPLEIRAPGGQSIICSILPRFADALIPLQRQPRLLPPSRLQVRPDNVYYRAPTMHQDLRRGARIFFYVTGPEKVIRGHARIKNTLVGTAEECIAAYGTMGILDLGDLEEIARSNRGKVLAIEFDWYEELEQPLTLASIQGLIPNFNPQGASLIDGAMDRQLRGIA